MRIQPESQSRRYLEWLRNIRPWCISRQLWWGHQIPVWYRDDEETYVGLEPPEGAELGARPRRARHLVLLGAVAVRDARLAAGDRRAACLLPDRRALDGARHPLPVGGADGDDGPRVHRRGPLRRRLRALGHPGSRRAAYEQVARNRHRPARRDRRARRRRGPLRTAGHVEHAGRALLLEKVRQGQALANKLFNAARYVLGNVVASTEPEPRPATIQDRWILSRLQEAKAQFDANLAAFDFAKAIARPLRLRLRRAVRLVPRVHQGPGGRPRAVGDDAARAARDAAARAPGHPLRDRGAVVARARRRGPAGHAAGDRARRGAARPRCRGARGRRDRRGLGGALVARRGRRQARRAPARARLDGLDGDAELVARMARLDLDRRRRADRDRARRRRRGRDPRRRAGRSRRGGAQARRRARAAAGRGRARRVEARQRGLRGQGARAPRRRRAREARTSARELEAL